MLFFSSMLLLCYPLAPLTPWPLQTGSTRVRGQTSLLCLPFVLLCFLYSSSRLSPPPAFSLVPTERHLILNFPHISCRACYLTIPLHQTPSSPPVSSSPPLRLPHLLLSVKLPLPVSHVLEPSRRCDLHLWSCSRQCCTYDVATCFDHPVCLASALRSPSQLMFVL